jgi:proline dehydrogenase
MREIVKMRNPLFLLAKRFIAGETIASALSTARALNANGLTATLDFLGEDVTRPVEAESTYHTYLRLLDAIRESGARANVSLKLTSLGLRIDEHRCAAYLTGIARHALRNSDPFVRVDMEGSSVTQQTLDIFTQAFSQHSNIGIVIQAYLHRSPADIERLIAMRARVRLCKGAYREPPTLAYRDMPTIRNAYLRLAESLLTHGTYPAIATHDEQLIQVVQAYAREHAIPLSRFEFQMLHGVRPQRQRTLAAAGYSVRVYVPFGTHWQSYLWRRITERKENLFFALSSLFRA